MNIEEGNKLIAEFMGAVPTKALGTETWDIPNMDGYQFVLFYHSSWDWLMPIVEKIESLDDSKDHYTWFEDEQVERSNFGGYSVDIETNTCTIDLNFELDPTICIVHSRADTKIEAVWQAVIKFIQRRNENTSSLQS